ncbi:MAG TPA: FecR domain-containing protein [Thermoanaerobaculia bacterium]|nr:FecR domain-containing protein [Thermoanaerobaculia bacterium]
MKLPPRKASRAGKDWYSISVDTLRSWGFLLLILVLVGVGLLAWQVMDRRSAEHQAEAVIAEAGGFLEQLRTEKRAATSFAGEYETGRASLEEAKSRFAGHDFTGALEAGKKSRNVLLSILDALALRGSSGQAQFNEVEGEVEFRPGEGGDWQEARVRSHLQPGDYVRTGENGSAQIMFVDGTLYTVRPNTQFIVTPSSAGGGAPEQAIEMEYGWVNLSTSDKSGSNVKTPGAMARVKEDSDAFVAVEKGSNQGRFGATRGVVELSSKSGLTREIKSLQQVVQTGDLLSEAKPLPAPPAPTEPDDNLALDLDQTRKLVLAWAPVPGASRYALQVSRNLLFVDNVIDAENRTRTRATLGVRGEGTFQWRVAAYGPDGLLGPWSGARKFRVASSRATGGEKKESRPPTLDLDDVKTYGSIFFVAGRSDPGARIEVNGEQVNAGVDGSFNKPVQLTKEGWNIIEIRARDAWGNETVRRHRVFVENP